MIVRHLMGKRILSVNLGNYGSTGTITYGIQAAAKAAGHTVCVAYPGKKRNRSIREGDYLICSDLAFRINHRLAYHSGLQGRFAPVSTERLLKKMEGFQPDLIHLHNLHGDFLNLPMLFGYIKRHHIPVVWTLHDCWAFTARCPYFTLTDCDKWKTGCYQCPYPPKAYPEGLLDCSRSNWKMKKNCTVNMENLTIITPSHWLANLARRSFLGKHPIEVIYNGIDLSVFKPSESDFRQKYHIGSRRMLLGVAFDWGVRKGLDVFIELSNRLDRKRYQIVLVGTTEEIDRRLPDSILSIHRTESRAELAKIYTAADLFVNPTREETLGLVNVEALACGTPVLTFRTGGSPECIDSSCGAVVECDDVEGMACKIVEVCETTLYSKEACRKRALAFDMDERYLEYVQLYERIKGGD